MMNDAAQPADLSFDAVEVGATASFDREVTVADVDAFAALSGDFNPLHMDDAYARTTRFQRRVVHGMFLASLLSRLVGMHLPGRRCLYLSQTLDFVQPVYIGDRLRVTGEVQLKQETTKTLVLRTIIETDTGQIRVRGKAHVQVLDP